MSEEPRFNVEFRPFAVDEKARCYWDTDLQCKNIKFIRDLEPEYFSYLAKAHGQNLDEDSKNRAHAATAVRSAHHHGIETLFALIFAGLQAPNCVIGWMQEYTLNDLRKLVGSVGDKPPRYLKIRPEPFTWESIGKRVFSPCYDKSEKVREMAVLFGEFCSRLAGEFLHEQHAAEYNSIKHGLRVTHKPTNIRLASKEGQTLAIIQGKHGSSFYVPIEIARSEGAKHLSLGRSFVNWDPEDLCADLELISVCIHNVRTWLLICNDCMENLIYRCDNLETFQEQLSKPGTLSRGLFKPGLTRDQIREHLLSKEYILGTYTDSKSDV